MLFSISTSMKMRENNINALSLKLFKSICRSWFDIISFHRERRILNYRSFTLHILITKFVKIVLNKWLSRRIILLSMSMNFTHKCHKLRWDFFFFIIKITTKQTKILNSLDHYSYTVVTVISHNYEEMCTLEYLVL